MSNRYINTKTGAIIDSSSTIVGRDWELYDSKNTKAKGQESTDEYVEEEINLEEMTKAELVALAKEHDIEVNEKDTKVVLIETIAKAFE